MEGRERDACCTTLGPRAARGARSAHRSAVFSEWATVDAGRLRSAASACTSASEARTHCIACPLPRWVRRAAAPVQGRAAHRVAPQAAASELFGDLRRRPFVGPARCIPRGRRHALRYSNERAQRSAMRVGCRCEGGVALLASCRGLVRCLPLRFGSGAPANAHVQLQARQIEARGEAARHPQRACHLRRSLGVGAQALAFMVS